MSIQINKLNKQVNNGLINNIIKNIIKDMVNRMKSNSELVYMKKMRN